MPSWPVARRAAGGWEVYEIPRPAVVTVKEGINLPRYPSVPGRLRARKKEIERVELGAARGRADQDPVARPGREGERGRDPRRGPGRRAAGRRGAPAPGAHRMILVVVEHEAGTPDRLSSEALTLGRRLAEATGSPLHAVAWGADAAAAAVRSRAPGSPSSTSSTTRA